MNREGTSLQLLLITLSGILTMTISLVSCNTGIPDLEKFRFPEYPSAVIVQTHTAREIVKAIRMTTGDPFESVLDFYTKELSEYDPERFLETSGQGRQAVLTLFDRLNRPIHVTIQEINGEDAVFITFINTDF